MNDVKRRLLVKKTIDKWCGTCVNLGCNAAHTARQNYTIKMLGDTAILYVDKRMESRLNITDLDCFCTAHLKEKEA